MYTTKVNVNDLVIDMPLDEGNVARMARIMEQDGQTIPIIIWLENFRIIDGFHRVAAAKQLGWNEIFCNVEDCNEEDFWDRRVVFSRPHHTLTDERLAIWITECWKATDWCQEGILPEVREAVWDVHKRIIHPAIDGHSIPLIKSLPPLHSEIYQWMRSKVERWNVSVYKLYEILFDEYREKQTAVELDLLAAKNNLNAKGRIFLARQMEGRRIDDRDKSGPKLASRREVEDYVGYLSTVDEMPPFGEYLELTEKAKESTTPPTASDYVRFAQSGKAYELRMKEELRRTITSHMNSLKANVKQNADVLTQLDDGYEMLMSLSAWAANKAAELFPDREQPTELQLRRELADAYKQIESLQKALDSRKGYAPKLPQVMAYSSTQISKS